jgi:succinate dehydrogenase / fumarate reductase cytochrome b subunit
MALTGQLMVLFVIAHVAGNLTIFFGKLNAYAAALHGLPLLLWSVRFVMAAAVSLHIYFAIQLSLENSEARPVGYRKKENLTSSFGGRNMVWTGAVIGTFIVYHLLHFTFQIIEPASAAFRNMDTSGRPDVFLMVARGLQRIGNAAGYLVAVIALWLHLSHGMQSSLQTWGLNGERSFPSLQKSGAFAAVVLFLAYASIPVALVAGWLLR